MFKGCTVALVTPFRDGDGRPATALGGLVDWHVEQGTPTISPVGTTGESPTLSHEEHERVIAAVVERAAGRARVMAGTGSNATSEAVRLTRFAARAGADGALLVAPYYNRPTQEGLYAHYARIAEATDLPLVLYNVPGRTGRNIEPATVERLAKIAPIVAIKEAAGSLDQVSEIRLAHRPDDPLGRRQPDPADARPSAPRGSSRWRPTSSRSEVIGLVDAFERGDLAEARRRHLELFPLCRDLLSIAANPIPVKTAMALLGRGNGELRLPLCPPDEAGMAALRAALRRAGLLTD